MPNYRKKILNKFRGYDASVDYYPADGEYCDRYFLRVSSDEVDNYAMRLLDEIWDEFGLDIETHDTEDGYDVWELI